MLDLCFMFLTSAVSTETLVCFTLLSSSSLCVFSFHRSPASKHFIRLQFSPKVGHFHFCFFPLVWSRLFFCRFSVSVCRHECVSNRLCVYNIVTVLFTCCSLSYQFLSALILLSSLLVNTQNATVIRGTAAIQANSFKEAMMQTLCFVCICHHRTVCLCFERWTGWTKWLQSISFILGNIGGDCYKN